MTEQLTRQRVDLAVSAVIFAFAAASEDGPVDLVVAAGPP